jgi:hypothetical protein
MGPYQNLCSGLIFEFDAEKGVTNVYRNHRIFASKDFIGIIGVSGIGDVRFYPIEEENVKGLNMYELSWLSKKIEELEPTKKP